MSVWRWAAIVVYLLIWLPSPALAQLGDGGRVVEFHFLPTERAQIAIWIENADGEFMGTVRLTQATSYRGIGNRPGATHMNSGFRWPYGRREGVLPVWGYRRAAAPGAEMFPRVIFQDRASEGFASRTSDDASRDDYFCLSFNAATTRRDALDAVSCASVFNSDKGRYMTPNDVTNNYAEPYQTAPGVASMRSLSIGSLYPPRRDVSRCTTLGCSDHEDVQHFQADARAVMPEIDAITMATPSGDEIVRLAFDVPEEWPPGNYVGFVEVNVEGDYNSSFDDVSYPTPENPEGTWDSWAKTYGYPYRGQPSVVYSVPFELQGAGAYFASTPTGYGSVDGADGSMNPMDELITNEPIGAPGSGADRLRTMPDGNRLKVQVISSNVCGVPEPPPQCGAECGPSRPCEEGFLCAPDETCVGFCDLDMPPSAVSELIVVQHTDVKHSHEWATLSFAVPDNDRGIAGYDVRVSTEPITDFQSFMQAIPANAAEIDSVALYIPTDGEPGELVTVDFGGLTPELHYYVAVRAVDNCNDAGPIEVAEVTTTKIHFTTVSPCFVATAAYGTPMAEEIGVLRRFRDRHLMSNAPGRALVDAYYTVGPTAADVIRDSDTLRAGVRVALGPAVSLAGWLAE